MAISIVEQLRTQPGYQLKVADVQAWERAHGYILAGNFVFVRSDWSRRWPDPQLATEHVFPSIELAALPPLPRPRAARP